MNSYFRKEDLTVIKDKYQKLKKQKSAYQIEFVKNSMINRKSVIKKKLKNYYKKK